MADTVTSQTIVDGQRNAVFKFTNVSDGTGESAITKVVANNLAGRPANLVLRRAHYDVQGGAVRILWGAAADVDAVVLAAGVGEKDFTFFGGLINNAAGGVTGDVKFTTVDFVAGSAYSIVLEFIKKY